MGCGVAIVENKIYLVGGRPRGVVELDRSTYAVFAKVVYRTRGKEVRERGRGIDADSSNSSNNNSSSSNNNSVFAARGNRVL